jgi:hypothetical protein
VNTYHIMLRKIEGAHAIPMLVVELSARAHPSMKPSEVIHSVESRWKSPWVVVGIEKSL